MEIESLPIRTATQLLTKKKYATLLVAGCSFFIFILTALAPVSNALSDPRPALLLSQAILRRHTIKLDAYQYRATIPMEEDYRLLQHNGHYYYFFPIGPSVLSLPFVWAANQVGLDMAIDSHNSLVQRFLSSLSCAFVFLLLFQIGRCYLDFAPSLVIAFVSVLGSSIASTMGTALWNINFAVLFITLSLWLIARVDSGQAQSIRPYWLGFLLFCAYFCRPSTAVFILLVLGYVFFKHRGAFLKTAAIAFACLVLFLLFNWVEYGRWLPIYSSLKRFTIQRANILVALYGLFFSPSRGIFTFSPFFALALLGGIWFLRPWRKHPLFVFSFLWIGLQVVLIARTTRWWGGWSYGPRLLTEIVPVFVLLTILLWRELSSRTSGRTRAIVVGAYLALGLGGILIHTAQGLYNRSTSLWNGDFLPNVDAHPEYLLDWRYPQFLASSELLCRRNLSYMRHELVHSLTDLDTLALGETLTYQSGPEQAIFIGWIEPSLPSPCSSATILFKLADGSQASQGYSLLISAGLSGRQDVDVLLNNKAIGRMALAAPPGSPQSVSLTFPAEQLRLGDMNEVEFRLTPVPRRSEPGIAFISLTILPH